MSETMDIAKKRLRHRSRYRGFKEVDIIFGRFADRHLEELDENELILYEKLLDAADQDVYAWIMGHLPVPEEHDHHIFRKLQPGELH